MFNSIQKCIVRCTFLAFPFFLCPRTERNNAKRKPTKKHGEEGGHNCTIWSCRMLISSPQKPPDKQEEPVEIPLRATVPRPARQTAGTSERVQCAPEEEHSTTNWLAGCSTPRRLLVAFLSNSPASSREETYHLGFAAAGHVVNVSVAHNSASYRTLLLPLVAAVSAILILLLLPVYQFPSVYRIPFLLSLLQIQPIDYIITCVSCTFPPPPPPRGRRTPSTRVQCYSHQCVAL